MKRREFIALLGGLAVAAPRATFAQTGKVFRLGTLTVGPPMPPTADGGATRPGTGDWPGSPSWLGLSPWPWCWDGG